MSHSLERRIAFAALSALHLAIAPCGGEAAAPPAANRGALNTAAADSSASGRGVRYVYLIRHGMYDRARDTDDRVGNGLDSLGHEQARLIGTRLAALPVRATVLVSSDYTRARETADDIGRALGMSPARDTLLRECTPTSDRAGRSDHPEHAASCDAGLATAFARYLRPSPEADRHDVLVCHGNVIRWMVSRALGFDSRRWHAMEIANGSLTILAVRPDGTMKLVMFSDVGHLPVEKQTWTGRGAGWLPAGSR